MKKFRLKPINQQRRAPTPCPVCGKHRGKGSDHSGCLKKLAEQERKS